MNRSPFFYVGDKYKLMPQLINIFPKDINRLVEPFCGGGSVFINTPAAENLANDNNKWMIKLHEFLVKEAKNRDRFFNRVFKIIKDYGFSASYLGILAPDELKKKYVKTYYARFNKEAYAKLKADFNTDKSDLYKLYLLLIYGFNHMLRFNSAGDFNLPVGNVDFNNNVFKSLNAYFDFAMNHSVEFSCLDFRKFLKKLSLTESDFVYIDPPYLISSSEYNKNWTTKEEKELLNLIDELNSKGIRFALSNVLEHKGLKNDLLIEWSKKYKVYTVSSNYISYYDNSVKKDTIEVLITNY
ncbi:MAG: Dam family site-specific DNA-(adenine-N6)-methyltransferase [Bacilli bacterium]|nr:Dam family site-specific DNA-(adenine-N6)-methyltransferase [Bacilli bacterium]